MHVTKRDGALDLLKWLALLSMLLDHLRYVGISVDWLYVPGRMAFPWFCLAMAANLARASAQKTEWRYLGWLLLFSAVSEIPYRLYIPDPDTLNVMPTLALGLLVARGWQDPSIMSRLLGVAALVLAAVFPERLMFGFFGVLLPLALLMGSTLADKLAQGRYRALRINGWLNLIIGVVMLLALSWFQLKKPVYEHGQETLSLVLVFTFLFGWILVNLLQAAQPLRLWAMPVLGSWLMVALLPAALPHSVVYNKTPDQFIIDHLQELQPATALLSNDLGAASALSWRLARPDVTLYNTVGEVKYGLAYPDAGHHKVDMPQVQQWMSDARKKGTVGVVMRVKGDDERAEIALLPSDGQRYEQGNIVILIFPQVTP